MNLTQLKDYNKYGFEFRIEGEGSNFSLVIRKDDKVLTHISVEKFIKMDEKTFSDLLFDLTFGRDM